MATGRKLSLPDIGECGNDGRPNNFRESVNSLNRQTEPYILPLEDSLDRIFREHDLAYDNAQNGADIIKADMEFINALKMGNW